jgi:hypothetical protein
MKILSILKSHLLCRGMLTVLTCFSISVCQTEQVVAVIDIVNHGKLSAKNIARVRACIRSSVSMKKEYIVLEPEIMTAMLEHQGARIDLNRYSDDYLLKLGKLLYAKKVVGGVLERKGNTVKIELKMMDVLTKKPAGASSIKVEMSLDKLLKIHVPKLVDNLLNAATPAPPPLVEKVKKDSSSTTAAPKHMDTITATPRIHSDTAIAVGSPVHKKSIFSSRLLWVPLSALAVTAGVVVYEVKFNKTQDNTTPGAEISLDDAPSRTRQ